MKEASGDRGSGPAAIAQEPGVYRYTGQQADSTTGGYYLRARYMDPRTGAFLSADPWRWDVRDPRTLHRYLYVSASPLDLADPSGLGAIWTGALALLIRRGALGRYVHKIIQDDFQAESPATRFAERSPRFFYGVGSTGRADLIDYGGSDLDVGEIYEIKYYEEETLAGFEVDLYCEAFMGAAGEAGRPKLYRPGTRYNYRGGPIAYPGYGFTTIYVNPTNKHGVITWSVLDGDFAVDAVFAISVLRMLRGLPLRTPPPTEPAVP